MTELFLGARRPPRARRLLRRLVLGAGLVLLIFVCAVLVFQRATTYAVPDAGGSGGELEARDGRLWLDGSSLEQLGQLWVIRTSGTPWQIGVAQGRLLAPLLAIEPDPLDVALLGEQEPEGWLARKFDRAGLRWRLRLLPDAMPRERREEVGGIAAGVRRAGLGHPTYQALIRRQAAPGLGAAPGRGLPVGGVASALSFAQGGLLARSFTLRGAAAPPAVVSFTRAAGALAYADVGCAGQVGVVTGINSEGIAVAYAPAVTDDVRAAALRLPLALLARQVLERATSLDEAVALISATPVLGAGSLLLVDGETGERALVAKSPGRQAVKRWKPDDTRPAWSGEGLAASEFDKDAENARARRVLAGKGREDRFAALVSRAAPGVAGALAVLRDRGELPLGHPGAVLDLSAQHAVVIDARAMLLWVADGGVERAWRVFDLRAELRGEPPRVLSADEGAADASVDASAVARARHGLRLGEDAARELRLGRPRTAAETAARAMALAPQLPEAYRQAALAAQALGKPAADLWRAYLARSPVDSVGLEDAKNALAGP